MKGEQVLVAVGLDRRGAGDAPRDLLRAMSGGGDGWLAELAAVDGIDEVAFLRTRRRVEILATTRFPSVATLGLRHALEGLAGDHSGIVALRGEAAFRHLVRLAAGLDASVLYEPQLRRELRVALTRAVGRGTAGRELARLLGAALHAAARVGIEEALGDEASWGDAAVALAEKVLGPLAGRRAAVAGTGEAAGACARRLATAGAALVVLGEAGLPTRSLALEVHGLARPLDALGDELLRADLIVAADALPVEALGPRAVAAASRARHRPLVLADLAVPRAIPAASGRVPDVFLCDEADLERVLRASLSGREPPPGDADRIVDEEVARWLQAEERPPGGRAARADGAAQRGDAR